MEIKTSGAIPLWLTRFLSENKIYKTSFSKYGTAYAEIQKRHSKNENRQILFLTREYSGIPVAV